MEYFINYDYHKNNIINENEAYFKILKLKKIIYQKILKKNEILRLQGIYKDLDMNLKNVWAIMKALVVLCK